MELRHLRYFVAVAEALSFTKAAASLRLAQPSLTRQVRNLEAEIGVSLFDRIHNRVALTAEGTRFLADARKILAFCAESIATVQRMKLGGASQLNIGYVANLPGNLLPSTLAAFRSVHPGVGLNLFDMSSADQLRALAVAEIDLGFIGPTPYLATPGLSLEAVAFDSMVMALPARHPLGKAPAVSLADLAAHFFIVMSARTHPGSREWLLYQCRLAGFDGRILQEADTESDAVKFVAGGLGVALLPAQSMSLPHEGVLFRPMSPPLLRPSMIAWANTTPSKELQEFIKVTKAQARRITGKAVERPISPLPAKPAPKRLPASRSRKRPPA